MRNPKAYLWSLIGIPIGLGLGLFAAPQPSDLTFLSVGQGDCAVLRNDGATMLIDAGGKSQFVDAGERLVVPKLRALGVIHVDLILLTHPDSDHIGGVGAVLRAFPGARLAASKEFEQHADLRRWLREWGVEPAEVLWLPPSGVFHMGDLPLRYVCPHRYVDADDNDASVFLKIGAGRGSAVLTGDAPIEVENRVAVQGDWQADILKAGHHGSRTATGAAWLSTVRPKFVIASLGRNNFYGHPHRAVIDRVAASGAQFLRTDRDGDIRFELRGRRFVRVR